MFDGTAESSKNNNPFAKYSGYMLLIIIICVPWIITLQSENSDLKDKLETANETIEEMDEEIFDLQERNSAWEVQVDELNMKIEELDAQYDETAYLLEELRSWTYDCVAICTPEDSTYHIFDCTLWHDSNYHVFSIEDAIAKGYRPCSSCQ